ncbi:unnamed protein product [Soboliphyme baturini]|uniref:Uncharacterized protein n=1 Tax=Soboliphyme baturini TaxID=241478 RepID=A0A183III4_9BILA|nr:unnamed protein product [Soboliphyme baturini]
MRDGGRVRGWVGGDDLDVSPSVTVSVRSAECSLERSPTNRGGEGGAVEEPTRVGGRAADTRNPGIGCASDPYGTGIIAFNWPLPGANGPNRCRSNIHSSQCCLTLMRADTSSRAIAMTDRNDDEMKCCHERTWPLRGHRPTTGRRFAAVTQLHLVSN